MVRSRGASAMAGPKRSAVAAVFIAACVTGCADNAQRDATVSQSLIEPSPALPAPVPQQAGSVAIASQPSQQWATASTPSVAAEPKIARVPAVFASPATTAKPTLSRVRKAETPDREPATERTPAIELATRENVDSGASRLAVTPDSARGSDVQVPPHRVAAIAQGPAAVVPVDAPPTAVRPTSAVAISPANPALAARVATGRIGRLRVAELEIFDAVGRPKGSIPSSGLAIPPGGLHYYQQKGMFLEIEIAGQSVWVKETQVSLIDERVLEPPRQPSRSPQKAIKGVSPGLR